MNSDNQLNAMQAMNCNLSDNLSVSNFAQQMQSGDTSNYQTNAINTNTLQGISAGLTNAIYNIPNTIGAWDYWQNWYYPQVIYQSYPVYIRERAMDKGKQAFEIIKVLKDKKLVKLEKVSDFIDLMDELIKIL